MCTKPEVILFKLSLDVSHVQQENIAKKFIGVGDSVEFDKGVACPRLPI